MASATENFKTTRATLNEMSADVDDMKTILADMAAIVVKLIETEKKAWAAAVVRSAPPEASLISLLSIGALQTIFHAMFRRRHDLSSTWGLLGLQPWSPPQLEDELSRKEGSSAMGRYCSRA